MEFRYSVELLIEKWRLLPKCEVNGVGWRSIPLVQGLSDFFRVGIRCPEQMEAILVGFLVPALPLSSTLPEGEGFCVQPAPDYISQRNVSWIALIRKPSGNLELFSQMAIDVLNVLLRYPDTLDDHAMKIFLQRIRSWQKFMEEKSSNLSLEVLSGLCGELETINDLIGVGIHPDLVISAWKGPLDAIHDFIFGLWEIEVKSTTSINSYHIKINSPEQLDTSSTTNLLLATVRFMSHNSGLTLSERIYNIKSKLSLFPKAMINFETLLMNFGIININDINNETRFIVDEKNYFIVTNEFPCVTKSLLPDYIVNFSYSINVESIKDKSLHLHEALTNIGAIEHGTY